MTGELSEAWSDGGGSGTAPRCGNLIVVEALAGIADRSITSPKSDSAVETMTWPPASPMIELPIRFSGSGAARGVGTTAQHMRQRRAMNDAFAVGCGCITATQLSTSSLDSGWLEGKNRLAGFDP